MNKDSTSFSSASPVRSVLTLARNVNAGTRLHARLFVDLTMADVMRSPRFSVRWG